MTVATEVNRNDYVGNGAVDTYGYTFRVLDDDDLLVQIEDTSGTISTLTKTTDYTVTGVGVYAGGNVVLVDNDQAWLDADGDLLTGYKISVRRRMDLLQPTDLRNRGSFYPETHETMFDRLVMYDQQQQDELDRALKFPQTDGTGLTVELPAASVRASKYMAFDASGNVIASGGGPGAVPVSAFMETMLDDATGLAAWTTLVASATASATLKHLRDNVVAETAPAVDDELLLYDLSATTVYRIQLQNLLKVLNGLTAEAATDEAADYALIYDANAAAVRKTLLQDLTSLASLKRTELSETNTGVVNFTPTNNSPGLNLGQVEVGDVIWYQGILYMTKGGAPGSTAIGIQKSGGTATLAFGYDKTYDRHDVYQEAASVYPLGISGFARVTVAGTVTNLQLYGISMGSNGSAAIGDMQLRAIVLKGT